MGYWGKLIGGTAGFFVGGPPGALIGAALGHAADSGSMQGMRLPFGQASTFSPIRVASMLGRKEEVFALGATVLAAKLCKVDGPVTRSEIDAFKRSFRIPPQSAQSIARIFDQARNNADSFEGYAAQLGETFADNRGVLEDVMRALFGIARADAPLNGREQEFLRQVHRRFGLDQVAWDKAMSGQSRAAPTSDTDPYQELGISRSATGEELRAAWKKLMRENHPDSLAARGVPADFIARASDKVARINAAWDRIKRERGL